MDVLPYNLVVVIIIPVRQILSGDSPVGPSEGQSFHYQVKSTNI